MRKPERTDRVRKFRLQIAGEPLEASPFRPKAWPEAQVWRDDQGAPCAYRYTVDGRHWIHLPGVGHFCFQGESDCVTAFPESSSPRWLVQDTYRRLVLPMAIQALGQEVLHASAVVTPQGVLVLCGNSGAGKSTLAFGLSRRGLPVWADDAVAFAFAGPTVRTAALPFRIRLTPESAGHFGEGASPAVRRTSGVRPLLAILTVERKRAGRGPVAVETTRLAGARAFAALLAHACCFRYPDPTRKRLMIQHYFALAAQVPVFGIRFQRGLENLPAVLDAIKKLVKTLHGVKS